MENSQNSLEMMRLKVEAGMKIAFKKLVLRLRELDEELVFSRDGKIVRVKARDIEV